MREHQHNVCRYVEDSSLASIDTVFNGPRLSVRLSCTIVLEFMPGGIIKLIILLCCRSVDKPYHFRNTDKKKTKSRTSSWIIHRIGAISCWSLCCCILLCILWAIHKHDGKQYVCAASTVIKSSGLLFFVSPELCPSSRKLSVPRIVTLPTYRVQYAS